MAGLSEHDRAIINCVFNPNLPLNEAADTAQQLQDDEQIDEQVTRNKQMEAEAIALTESGKLEDGLSLINRAIVLMPKRPSLYNNRAHIYQFLRKFPEAMADLTIAINLCTEKYKKTLCQAHSQRGLLHRRLDSIEEARADFGVAAEYGDTFAKSQLVQLNPYAAMCNQMLMQVMESQQQ